MSTEATHEGHPGEDGPGDGDELAFFVNDERIVVYASTLTLREILDDAGYGVATHVLVKRAMDGSESVYSNPDEELRLEADARFYTRPRVYHIKINGRARTTEINPLSYDEVVKLSELPPLTDGMEYLVTFSDAVKPTNDDLIEGESVEIKDGTYFVVTPSNRS